MNLKQASLAEFETVFDILHQNARWLGSKDIFQWPLEWLDDQRAQIRDAVDCGRYYTVALDNGIAAVVEIKSDPEQIWGNDQRPALYVHKLAIGRRYADQRLGRKILNLIEQRATLQGIEYLRLDCVADNSKLRQYYESCNFQFINEVNAGEVNLALYQYKVDG